MASPVPPEPSRGNVPVTPKRRNRLALTSFLLSLAPLVAWGLLYLVSSGVLGQPGSPQLPDDVYAWILEVLSLGSLSGSIGAILTGGLALRRVKQYSPQQAWKGVAIAGLVIGIVGTTLLISFLVNVCSYGCFSFE